jgi:hypothetical protein
MPTAAELWGDGAVAETFEAVVHDENGPGGNSSGGWTGLPPFIMRDGASLRIDQSDKPGRLYFLRTGTHSGETCQPARFCLNVGPTIDDVNLQFENGTRTLDLYALCNVGDLLPKRIQVFDLPVGVTFNDATGLLVDDRTDARINKKIRIRLYNAINQRFDCVRNLVV